MTHGMHRQHQPGASIAVLSSLVGIALAISPAAWALDDEPVELVQAYQEVPEDRLLDVGIHIFETGIPEDEHVRYLLEEKGVFEDVRKSEARWIPILLKRALESSGFWGAVRLVPEGGTADLILDGAIVTSNGKKLEIDVMVFDASGGRWLGERYEQEADPLAYADEKTDREPFQSLYNRVANDLLKELQERESEELVEIRRVAELKFARDLAPSAFQDYLTVKKGRYSPARLPAEGDPMMERVAAIRDRDYMFIDTLNEYYADFYSKMETPYESWRSFSYEEQMALDKLNKAARWEKILGAAAIVGGVVASRKSRGRGGDVLILGGMAAMMDGFDKSEQAKMHREALRELAGSLDADVSEILLDVEGEVLRLSGSVETQYASWRQILREIFATELGLPLDPNQPVVAPSGTTKS